MAAFKGTLGSGERFKRCVASNRGKVRDPEALCASIGRKKFGKKRFAQLGKQGRR
ncbi:hypothetical protein LCGC14_0388700 [marine sediment metagenome]|uniref:Uncharacterized protein n=1 Tax=marine sediment metagenome TaxID=412755 RepID=A0A0F9W9A8_9ZZZZ